MWWYTCLLSKSSKAENENCTTRATYRKWFPEILQQKPREGESLRGSHVSQTSESQNTITNTNTNTNTKTNTTTNTSTNTGKYINIRTNANIHSRYTETKGARKSASFPCLASFWVTRAWGRHLCRVLHSYEPLSGKVAARIKAVSFSKHVSVFNVLQNILKYPTYISHHQNG